MSYAIHKGIQLINDLRIGARRVLAVYKNGIAWSRAFSSTETIALSEPSESTPTAASTATRMFPQRINRFHISGSISRRSGGWAGLTVLVNGAAKFEAVAGAYTTYYDTVIEGPFGSDVEVQLVLIGSRTSTSSTNVTAEGYYY